MILAVLQARMSSTRLPGKVMKPLLGEPMILRQLERLRRTKTLGALVVATSDDASDDPLTHQLQAEGVATHRGSLHDVLDRFSGAVAAFGPAEHVVRLTADCPLADPKVIDACVRLHVEGGFDYTANDHPPSFPRGLDVEVMTAEALRLAASEATDPAEREHVTMFLYRRPERFRIGHLVGEQDLSRLRWTVDTAADYAFVERVYGRLYLEKPDFTTDDILALDFERTEADN
jgi:spore coat polysaccharide biosynthesis protein SpsF